MLKVVISTENSDLLIESGSQRDQVRLTISTMEDEDVVESAAITVDKKDLFQAIAFVMGNARKSESEDATPPVSSGEHVCG